MKKLLFVVLLALCIIVSPVLAATITTDKSDYVPESIVTISGTGFSTNTPVVITVTRPDASKETVETITDPSGAFKATYKLLNAIEGTYDVYAIDSMGENALTTFTDSVYPPIPEFPSLAIPVGMMIGILGVVFFIQSREK
jgi:hypothetical protein